VCTGLGKEMDCGVGDVDDVGDVVVIVHLLVGELIKRAVELARLGCEVLETPLLGIVVVFTRSDDFLGTGG
jgi:hypothetical protein